MKTIFRLIAAVCLLARSAFAGPTSTSEFSAAAFFHDAFQLTPSVRSVSRPILIDATRAITVKVLAASQTLDVSITGPDGIRRTVTAFAPINGVAVGASYLITVENPPVGTWTLQVNETATLTEPIDVLATTFINNNRWLVLAGGGDEHGVGTDIRLALVAFDGTVKAKPLTIDAQLLRPFDTTFAPIAVTFHDDGTGGDEHGNDGIYETVFSLTQPGEYQVQANATATIGSVSFRRTAAAGFSVVRRNAQISGFSDRGIDDNADGLFDRVVIAPSANIAEAGTYLVDVKLRASNGHELHHTTTQTFAIGNASPELSFTAAEINSELGVAGPYAVAEVRWLQKVGSDFVTADRRFDLGFTSAYTFAQLQHSVFRIVGPGHTEAYDTDGNGLYNVMWVVFPVEVDVTATYVVSGTLHDIKGRPISFRWWNNYFIAGETNELNLPFTGDAIGPGNFDGPYTLPNMSVEGYFNDGFDRQVFVERKPFITEPYKASQFEGFVGPKNLPTVLGVTPATGTYGGATTLSARLTSGGSGVATKSIAFSLNGTALGTAVTDGNGVATLSASLGRMHAGAYPSFVTASFGGDATYAASNGAESLTINQKPVTGSVTVENKEYDGTKAAMIASRALDGVIAPDVVALSGGTATFVDKNYGVAKQVNVSDLKLTGADADNYAVNATATAYASISRATLTVRADNTSRAYASPNPQFNATYSGFKNGETLATAPITGAPALTTLATQTSAVGSYAISAGIGSLGAENYTFAFVDGTLTINRKTLTASVTVADKEYDGTTAAAISSRSLDVIAPDVTLIGGTAAFVDKNYGVAKQVNVTGLSLSGAAADNYTVNATATAYASITKTTLTVRADNTSRAYGSPNPLFNASYSGFKNGETFATAPITGAPALTTLATQTSAVGAYAISAGIGSLAAENYTFAFVDGTLTIKRKTITASVTVADKEYDGTTAATISSRSLDVIASDVTLVGGTAAFVDKNYGVAKQVNVTGLNLSGAAADNYTVNTTATAFASITKATLTVRADNVSRPYLSPNPSFTVTYAGFKNGETFTTAPISGAPIVSTTATETSAPGTYLISVGIGTLAADNYKLDLVDGTLNVFVSGIVGLEGVFIGSAKGVVDSFDSTVGYPASAGTSAFVLSNGAIEISGARVGGSVLSSRGSVLIGPGSIVTGNVSAGTTITNQGTAGSLTPGSPSGLIKANAVAPCGAYTVNPSITGGRFTYSDGDLSVASGATITLGNGTYCFHNVTLSGNATLSVNGPVSISLTGVLNAAAGALNNNTSIPKNLQIASSYAGPDGVTLSGNANAYLTIYAPTTKVTVTGGSPVFGALLGKSLEVSGNSQVHYDVRLPEIWATYGF